MNIKQLIDQLDYEGIDSALSQNPSLANEGVPYDATNTAKAHPLHRICDGVFSGKYTDTQAVELAKIFLKHGAKIDGNEFIEKCDTPLVAAASLYADQVGILYIESGANIHHGGCHGGTALHWAAWCGRPVLLKKLVAEKAEINKLCIDFKSSPLFWAVHGLKQSDGKHFAEYTECVKILLEAGADKSIPNLEGYKPFDLLKDDDTELKELLK